MNVFVVCLDCRAALLMEGATTFCTKLENRTSLKKLLAKAKRIITKSMIN